MPVHPDIRSWVLPGIEPGPFCVVASSVFILCYAIDTIKSQVIISIEFKSLISEISHFLDIHICPPGGQVENQIGPKLSVTGHMI